MTHNEVVIRAVQWLRAQGYHAALAEPTCAYELPDAIGWTGYGKSAVIECKISRSDFKADLKKPVHRRPEDLTFGNHRWYMAPKGILKPEEIPKGHGLLEIRGSKVHVVLKAPAQKGHAEAIERGILATTLGRVQREHFGTAFACPEGYMEARVWLHGLPPSGDPLEIEVIREEITLEDLELRTDFYCKLACADRLRSLSGKIQEAAMHRTRVTSRAGIPELLAAIAHLHRAERILTQALRAPEVEGPPAGSEIWG